MRSPRKRDLKSKPCGIPLVRDQKDEKEPEKNMKNEVI